MPVFELALSLHKTVAELLETMSYQEFALWMEYFDRRPYGWREDDRTYKLLRAQGMKSGPETVFHSLALMKQHEEKRKAAAVPKAGSFLHAMMMNAKGGEKLDILEQL